MILALGKKIILINNIQENAHYMVSIHKIVDLKEKIKISLSVKLK